MKKNIALIQSVLILSLITPSTSFSMLSTKKKPSHKKALRQQKASLKNSTDTLKQQNPESSPAETATKSIMSQLPALPTSPQAITTESIETEVTVKNPDLATTSFKNVINQLNTLGEKPASLKSAVIIRAEYPQTEADVNYERYQTVLSHCTKPVALKKTLTKEASFSKEELLENISAEKLLINQDKTHNDMCELVKNQTAQLKTVTFTAPDLSQSILPTEMPKEKGLSGWLYTQSFVRNANDLIFDALHNGTFNSNNETHLKMLDDAFNYYVDNNNRDRVIKALEICQYLEGDIELNELTARKVHNFLENITAEKEKAAEATLATKRDLFMTQRNTMIIALQEDLARRTKELNDQLNNYEQACTDAFTVEANQIRTLKTSTAIIHALNPRLLLGKQESCSDKIDCLSTKHIKKYMCQADVDTVHSNERILKRIKADEKMVSLKENTLDLYSQIAFVNRTAQDIKMKQDRPALPNPLLQSSSNQ